MTDDNVVDLSERRLLREGYVPLGGVVVDMFCNGCDDWVKDVFTWVPSVGLLCSACAKGKSA